MGGGLTQTDTEKYDMKVMYKMKLFLIYSLYQLFREELFRDIYIHGNTSHSPEE